VMTFRFVPGGPEPITKGFGNFNPSTVVARVGIGVSFNNWTETLTAPLAKFDNNISPNRGAGAVLSRREASKGTDL
jgi:hypothetical protein